MDNDILIYQGDAVKALGEGRVGGYLVRFTKRGDYDLDGDRFDAQTDLGDADKLPVLYNHGLDAKLGRKRIGKSNARRDDVGLWVEGQLALRDEYERAIYALAEQGKLSWSSGAAAHTVERETEGKGAYIKQWFVTEASLTPTPAEPRNSAISIKSLNADGMNVTQATDEAVTEITASGAADATPEALEQNTILAEQSANEEKTMDENETKTAPANDKVAELEKQLGELKAKMEAAPAINGGAPAVKKVTERGFANDETKSFLHWIRTGDEKAYKAAMQGQTDSEGGYAVPDDFYNQIVAKRDQVSVMRIAGIVPVQTTLDRILVPTEGTSATKFVVTAEEGSYDENEPTLGQKIITIHKLTKLIKISEELEADAKADFSGWLSNVWGRALGLAENYYFCNIAANGSGVPESVTYAATATTAVASQTATTAAELLTLIYSMPSAYADNMRLLMRRSTLGAFRALASSSIFTFQPTPLGSGAANVTNASPNGELHGVPVLVTDDLPAQAAANVPVVLFNPDFYFIAERQGLTVKRNEALYMATGQIGLFASVRIGGGLTHATTAYQLVSKT